MATAMSSYNFNIINVGSYGVSTGTLNASISGTYGLTTANLPLFIKSDQAASGSLTLVMNAIHQIGTWESNVNRWNVSSVNWEVNPSKVIVGTTTSNLTISMSGARIIESSGTLPLFLYNSGLGNIEESLSLFLYSEVFAENNISSVTVGHEITSDSMNLFLSGEDLSITGSLTCAVPGMGVTTKELRVYIHGE